MEAYIVSPALAFTVVDRSASATLVGASGLARAQCVHSFRR
jgi:hypothetical protein